MKIICLCGDNFEEGTFCPNCSADAERIEECMMEPITPEAFIELLRRKFSIYGDGKEMDGDDYLRFLRAKELVENFWFT